MYNQHNHDDDDLIYFFKNFESLLEGKVPTIDTISAGSDFYVFRTYFARDLRQMQDQLKNADDTYLLKVAEHMFNIIDWVDLIVDNRGQAFRGAVEHFLEQEFGNKKLLETLYDLSFDKWLTNKNGQYEIGINTYTVRENKIYYRNRFEEWYEIDKKSAFEVQPSRILVGDNTLIAFLNASYSSTSTDLIIHKWNDRKLNNVLPDDFLQFSKETTSPEEYFEYSIEHIKLLLENPVSISELERWNGETIVDLEETIKLCTYILKLVKDRRSDKSHTVYLLRDCLLFYEAHKVLDILYSEETSSDQLLIGRKMLSHQPDKWGYYIVTIEALYEAHKRYPDNYSKFYEEFMRLIDLLIAVNPKFQGVINALLPYIQHHIQTNENKIIIFDVGFQGSINLLIQYIIDRHITPNTEHPSSTDIEVAVGALWSAELFGDRIKSDYFPFLNRVQRMATSEELYHYEFNGLQDKHVRVTMGGKAWQKKAAVERVVLAMLAQLD